MPSEARHEISARLHELARPGTDNSTRTEFEPSAAAYRVPWRVDRSRAPWCPVFNHGDEEVSGVHLMLHGDGRLLWQPLLRVPPGEAIEFVVRAADSARDCIAVLRWFRPDGTEYLWRIAF